MNIDSDSLTPSELGERLRLAREAAGITQAASAASIGMSRTTLVAIEQGQRRVRIDELQKLAVLYGSNVNTLLRREAIHVDIVPRFRKIESSPDASLQAATKLLSDLAKAEVELENLLGIRRTTNYPQERPILPGNIVVQAEQDAMELRQRSGLGFQPVLDMVTFLEFELGVRVYVRKLDGSISGMFVYDERLGACILLNANQRRERRNWTAAHELGHLVSTRRDTDVVLAMGTEKPPEERYANAFARAFLMPARQVIQRFQEVTAGSSTLTRRHVIVLAHTFGVSREAMVRRLEDLDLVKPGAWDKFHAEGGISDDQVKQVLGELAFDDADKESANRPTTLRLGILANEARRQDLVSEGQLAKLLNLDRIELRELLDDQEDDGEAGDGACSFK